MVPWSRRQCCNRYFLLYWLTDSLEEETEDVRERGEEEEEKK